MIDQQIYTNIFSSSGYVLRIHPFLGMMFFLVFFGNLGMCVASETLILFGGWMVMKFA